MKCLRWCLPAAVLAALVGQPSKPPIRFEDVTEASGVKFTHSFGSQKLGSLLESTGGGAVWFDYNNDGKLDLYVVSGIPLEKGMHPYPLRKAPDVPPHNHLYRNDGNGKFTDVTDQAGVAANVFSMGAIAADYDNDGFVDLFVSAYGRVVLFHNNGNGTFTDVTEKAGLSVPGWSIGSVFLDYDRDGCVDLFVGRYVKFDPTYRAYYPADNYPGPLDYEPESNMLFHNNCNGTFTDVSAKSGLAEFKSRAMGVTAGDFDRDGWPDIYVANDKTENYLFHNEKNGTFKEIAVSAGVAYGQSGENTSAMGPIFLDFDHDGKVDLWVSDSKYNRLMKSVGNLKFQDFTEHAGISQLAAQYVSWGTGAYDFDNDGWEDLFIAHGGLIHMVPMEHSVLRNLGDWKFEDVSSTAGPYIEKVKSVARGTAFGDFDDDGRMDAFIVNLGAPAVLLHNVTASPNHWAAFKLVGSKSNKDGIGAQVEVFAGGRHWQRERVGSSGYLSCDDGRVRFGIGAAAKIEKVVVTWPTGGAQQVVENVSVDRVTTITEK